MMVAQWWRSNMDKIIIITDFRIPKEGDRFITNGASNTILSYNKEKYNPFEPRFIVGAEIPIPANAKCLSWSFRDSNKDIPDQHGTVILPRKKVTKWKFRHEGYNGVSCITEKYHTEKEMKMSHCDEKYWRKVPGSEIEVEE
jgi:hypothetical protein